MLSSLLAVVLLVAPLTLSDELIAGLALELLTRNGPNEDLECAAFIVGALDGTFSLQHWPSDHSLRGAQQWLGPVPAGVVAIIHTHPHTSPLPSMQDASEARRTQLPFYVVSRGSLSVVDPAGRVREARRIPWLSVGNAPMRWRDVSRSTSSTATGAGNS